MEGYGNNVSGADMGNPVTPTIDGDIGNVTSFDTIDKPVKQKSLKDMFLEAIKKNQDKS